MAINKFQKVKVDLSAKSPILESNQYIKTYMYMYHFDMRRF